MGRLEELFEHLKDNPDDSFAKFGIAQEYAKMGERKKALEQYQQLVKDDPDYVGAYYHLGKLHEKMNNDDTALEIYKLGMDVAVKQGDKHALNELQRAYNILVDEDDF